MTEEPEEHEIKFHKGGLLPTGGNIAASIQIEYVLTYEQWGQMKYLFDDKGEE